MPNLLDARRSDKCSLCDQYVPESERLYEKKESIGGNLELWTYCQKCAPRVGRKLFRKKAPEEAQVKELNSNLEKKPNGRKTIATIQQELVEEIERRQNVILVLANRLAQERAECAELERGLAGLRKGVTPHTSPSNSLAVLIIQAIREGHSRVKDITTRVEELGYTFRAVKDHDKRSSVENSLRALQGVGKVIRIMRGTWKCTDSQDGQGVEKEP